ncbi:hypothetical protein DF947_13870 [Pedobacter paludis]|uniref:IPTL-CTERM protein sorting domain-containing protein n=1 Tax=Pedobacter paludis TaxID=2203212 RepID=A0A317F2G2_9SPHI|nr:hypothetical protein DF947_13870 [Pedobacter paludis]
MGKFKILFLFGLFCFILENSYAQTGCIGDITGNLYVTNTGGTTYNLFGTSYANPESLYCIIPKGGTCSISGFGGTLVTYGLPAGCSLDEYILPFAMGLSALTFYYIRRRKIQGY